MTDKTQVQQLMKSLPKHQQDAIKIIKLALDCYNSVSGSGLFAGMERYNVLHARTEIAAVQSQSLFDFWSILQKRMCWTLPSKASDALVVDVLTGKDDRAVLSTLVKDTVSIITIARLLHDSDKKTRKELKAAEMAELQMLTTSLNQPLPEGF